MGYTTVVSMRYMQELPVPALYSTQRILRMSRHVNISQRSVGDRLNFEQRFPDVKLVTLELPKDLVEETERGRRVPIFAFVWSMAFHLCKGPSLMTL